MTLSLWICLVVYCLIGCAVCGALAQQLKEEFDDYPVLLVIGLWPVVVCFLLGHRLASKGKK